MEPVHRPLCMFTVPDPCLRALDTPLLRQKCRPCKTTGRFHAIKSNLIFDTFFLSRRVFAHGFLLRPPPQGMQQRGALCAPGGIPLLDLPGCTKYEIHTTFIRSARVAKSWRPARNSRCVPVERVCTRNT
ncbi:hypothetical protein NDU88_005755 [Pleurodeles waltl]|uniref:Uncharacterized protein n=1 Tax=Pleurodeles waltl TaxID=8319 RepID=A0AAV7LDF7_PLEWA|nr:hypothetical protein NDU88_005755 [Pleurodeles waltl]